MQTEITVYPFVVQFEELDAGGVVHHPNYLKFLERARCHAMAERGYPFGQCMTDGSTFVVAEVLMRYLRPAKMGDRLYVVSATGGFKKSSMKVYQAIVSEPPPDGPLASAGGIFRLPGALFQAQLRLVNVEVSTGRPVAMSDVLRRTFRLGGTEARIADPREGDVRLETDWDSL